jgi:hypothetical protein
VVYGAEQRSQQKRHLLPDRCRSSFCFIIDFVRYSLFSESGGGLFFDADAFLGNGGGGFGSGGSQAARRSGLPAQESTFGACPGGDFGVDAAAACGGCACDHRNGCFSALMMASLEQAKGLGKVLSHKRVVWFGLVSYSLYLWHWGVLSISRWTIGIHWWSLPFQLGLIVLLAAISYRYIEKPLRNRSWGSTSLATLRRGWFAVAGFVIASFGIAKYVSPRLYFGPDPAGLQRDRVSGVNIPCNYYRGRVSFEPVNALG